MTYRDIAAPPAVVGNDLDSLKAAYERLARQFRAHLVDYRVLKARMDALRIQGVSVSTASPSDDDVLTYDAATETWGPEAP